MTVNMDLNKAVAKTHLLCNFSTRKDAENVSPSTFTCRVSVFIYLSKQLLMVPPDFLPQDAEKRTPLHAAAFLGDAEITELLILSGIMCPNFASAFIRGRNVSLPGDIISSRRSELLNA